MLNSCNSTTCKSLVTKASALLSVSNLKKLFLSAILFVAVSISANAARVFFNIIYKANGSSYTVNSNSYTNISSVAGTNFAFTSDDPNSVTFPGNDILGKLSYTNGNGVLITITGTVSRRSKNGTITESFNFMPGSGAQYTTLTGEAYLLVMPGKESAFSNGITVATSSDQVNADLNGLLTTQQAAPTITLGASTSLLNFIYCVGSASNPKSFSISGSNLTAPVTITAPTGFQVSLSSGGSYASSVTVTPASGSIASTLIYVRVASGSSGLVTGNVSLTSTGAISQYVSVRGGHNNAVDFDGINDYVSLPAAVYFNNDVYTVEGWVYAKTYADWGRIADFGSGSNTNNVLLSYSQGTTGKPAMHIYNGNSASYINSNQQIPLNQWVHIAAVRNGSSGYLYINGQLSASNSVLTVSTPATTRTSNYIGRSNWSVDAYPNAMVDEVRVWNTARTQAEIQTGMSAEITGSETGLVAAWDLNIGVPNGTNTGLTTVYDLGPNGYNGTAVNMALTGNTSNYVSRNQVTVVAQPNATSSACVGATASALTVSAGGASGYTYQWYSNTTNSNTGGTSLGSANGAQTNTYTPPTSNVAGTFYYYVVITGDCSATVTSNVAAVTYNVIPTLSSTLGSSISTNALKLYVDAGNTSSYPGTGNTWTDLSGSGNNMTLANTTYSSANGGSLNFPGNATATSTATVPSMNLQNGFTVVQALKLSNYNGGMFRYNGPNYPYYINYWMGGNSHMRWETYAGNAFNSNAALPLNGWVIVSGTFSGVSSDGATGTAKLYINGVLDNTGTLQSQASMPISEMVIGEYAGNMNGSNAVTMFYNRELSLSEIQQNFNFFAPRFGLSTITGVSSLSTCSGATFTYHPTSATAGVTFSWSRAAVTGVSNAAATGTGDVSEVLVNTTTDPIAVTYTYTLNNNGCTNTQDVIVVVNPPVTGSAISGSATTCIGASTTYTNATAGGTWSSSNTAVATVSSTGVVTGVAAGGATITYTVTNSSGCTATSTKNIAVNGNAPTIAPVSAVSVCSGSSTSPISFSPLASAGYQWMSMNTVGSTTASGSGQNGITVSITQSGGGMAAYSGMYSPSRFPAQYSIPTTTQIQNVNAGVFTATFSQPVTNPIIAFASVGNPGYGVPVIVSAPFTPIWTDNATAGWHTDYDLPNNTFTGYEGFNIIRIDGTVTSVSFNYTRAEYYSTICFGFEDQNVSYNWTNNNTSIGLGASGTGNILPFSAINNTTTPAVANITVIPVTSTCSGSSTSFTITVNPTATVNSVSNQVISAGTATTAVNFTGAAGTTFAWTNNATSIGLAASGTGNIPSFTPVNNTTAPIVATVTVTPTSASSCAGSSTSFTYTINPAAQVNPVPTQVVSNGQSTTAINFTTNNTGGTTTYQWTNNNTSVGLAASGTGSIPAFVAVNTGTSPQYAQITVTPYYTSGGVTTAGTPIVVLITVNPTPQVNAVTSQSLCTGSNTTAVAFSTINTGGVTTYSWTNNAPSIGLAASGTGNIASFVATNTGSAPVIATITVTPTYTNALLSSQGPATVFTIIVNPTPTVDAVSNQTVCNDAATTAITFAGAVTGTTYSWTNSNSAIGLAASGTGNIASFTAVNTGTTPVTSTVTVTPSAFGPAPGVAIASPVTINYADRYITYTGVSINGGSNSAIVAPGSSVSLNYNYSVAFNYSTGYCPGCVVQFYVGLGGSSQTLTCVNPIGNGSSGTQSATFTAPSTPGVYYLTQSGTLDYVCQPQAFNNLPSNAIGYIQVGATGCVGAPRTFTITVNPTPTVAAVSNQALCNGLTTTAVSFTGTVTGTTYSWTNSAPSIGLAASGTGNIPAFTAVNTGGTAVTATITVTPSANGCAGTPITYTYTVNPTSTVNAVSNQTVCNGAATSAVTFSGAVAGEVFSWTNNTTSIGLAAAGTGNIPSFTAVNTGTTPVTATVSVTANVPGRLNYTMYSTHGGNGNTSQYGGYANSAAEFDNMLNTANSNTTITSTGTANPASVIYWNGSPALTAAGITVPNGGDYFAIKATGTFVAAETGTYTFAVDGDDAVDVAINGTVVCSYYGAHGFGGWHTGTVDLVAGTSYTFTARMQELGGGEGIYVAWKRPSQSTYALQADEFVGGCASAVRTFTITVNPTPTVSAVSNQTVCNGSNTTAVTFAGAVTGTTYAWTNSNTAIGLAATGTGNIASFAATNTTAAPITSTITATPSANGCTGSPTSFTITVNPTATVNAIANQVLCKGSNTTAVTFAGPVAGTTYAWTNSNTAIGLAASGTGTGIPSFATTNTTTAPLVATITVTPTANGCVGTPLTFTITVNPTPTVAAVSNQVLCHGSSTAAVTFAGTVTGTVFNWTNTNTSIGLAASGSGNIASFVATNTGSAQQVATVTVTPSYTNGGVTCLGTPITFTITVNPLPVVSAGTLPSRICISDSLVALNGTPVGGYWTGIGTSGFNFVPNAAALGSYTLRYTFTNANNCTNSATIVATVNECAERNKTLANGAISMYPNPTNGQVTMKLNTHLYDKLEMRIYKANGQYLGVKTFTGLTYGRTINLDLSYLPNGVYFIKLTNDIGINGGTTVIRLIVQH